MALCLSLWTSCWCNIMCVHVCRFVSIIFLTYQLVCVCVCLCKPLRLNSIPKISSEMPNSHLRKMCYIKNSHWNEILVPFLAFKIDVLSLQCNICKVVILHILLSVQTRSLLFAFNCSVYRNRPYWPSCVSSFHNQGIPTDTSQEDLVI